MDGRLPLFDVRPPDDASHRVRAPGGYEWWHFDAEDPDQGLYFAAMFSQGWIGNPRYAARYAAYRGRPTRNAPPVPAEYPALNWGLFQNGRALAQFKLEAEPKDFAASEQAMDVTIAKNRVFRDGDGILRLSLHNQTASANIAFKPILSLPPSERPLCSRGLSGAENRWIIADPLCEVHGEIRLGQQTIPFHGPGYHDHYYGGGPLTNVRRWCWGRVLEPDRAWVFQIVTPRDRTQKPEMQLIRADAAGIHDGEAETIFLEKGLSGYPPSIRLDQMRFGQPLRLDRSPLRLAYRRLNSPGAPLICQIVDL